MNITPFFGKHVRQTAVFFSDQCSIRKATVRPVFRNTEARYDYNEWWFVGVEEKTEWDSFINECKELFTSKIQLIDKNLVQVKNLHFYNSNFVVNLDSIFKETFGFLKFSWGMERITTMKRVKIT